MIRATVALLVPLPVVAPTMVVVVDSRPDHLAQLASNNPREFTLPIQWEMGREVLDAARALNVDIPTMLQRCWNESKLLPGRIGVNQNGTRDFGVCQVNDRWTPEIVQQNTRERIWTAVRIMLRNYRAC